MCVFPSNNTDGGKTGQERFAPLHLSKGPYIRDRLDIFGSAMWRLLVVSRATDPLGPHR